jgi:hypothetical protein
MKLLRLAAPAAVLVLLLAPAPASASQLIARNARNVGIKVDRSGRAMLTYRANGRVQHVLAFGAINARPPAAGKKQVQFRVDYGGGWGFYHKRLWEHFPDTCRRYDGPKLAWFVTGCKAPDGSYWALQNFPQPLPDLGYTPWLASQRAVWLELSHWSGPLPQLSVWQDWVYGGRFDEIAGQFTYRGTPVYGFGTTRFGAPTDGFGRLIYLDTLDAPAYGSGWRRENSFVPHNPTGAFCYGFYTFDPTKGGYKHPAGQTSRRGPGVGTAYRITAGGPGVTPDVTWQGPALGPWDPNSPDDQANQTRGVAQLKATGDNSCLPGH